MALYVAPLSSQRHRRRASHQHQAPLDFSTGLQSAAAQPLMHHRPRPSEPLVAHHGAWSGFGRSVDIVAPEPVKIVKMDEWKEFAAIRVPKSAGTFATGIDRHNDADKEWPYSAADRNLSELEYEAYSDLLEILSLHSSPDLSALGRDVDVSPLSTPPVYDSDGEDGIGGELLLAPPAMVQPPSSPIPRTHNPLPLDWSFPVAARAAVPAIVELAPLVAHEDELVAELASIRPAKTHGHKRKSASLSLPKAFVPRVLMFVAQDD